MQGELRRRACNAGAVRNRIERMLQFRMLLDIRLQVVQRFAGLCQHAVELGTCFCFGLGERHLHPAMGIDFALAGGLDGQEDHVLKFIDDSRLDAIRLRRRHAAERLERQHHVAKMIDGVVDVLAYFHITFAATSQLMVKGVSQAGEFFLRNQMVRGATQVPDGAVVKVGPHDAACAETASFLEQLEFVGEAFFHLIPFGILVERFGVGTRLRSFFGNVHHVGNPGRNRFDQHLRTFFFKEGKHIEIAVALGSLGPEFTGDFDDRFHPQAVDFDGVNAVATSMQRIDIFFAVQVVSDFAQSATNAFHLLVRFKIMPGPDAVDGNGIEILEPPSISAWYDEIQRLNSELQRCLIVSPLEDESRVPETARFFRERGNQSLCLLPLNTDHHCRGVLCIGREDGGAFAEQELSFLSLIACPIALAIDEWLKSEAMRAQLESERKKLKLILDLNNSVISNLEMRDVLQSISPSLRKVLRLDGVVLMLPDAESKNLRTHALDFPSGKELAQHDLSRPLDTSLAGQVFRSGKHSVGDIHELRRSGFEHQIPAADGVETLCLLPLVRCKRVLGVLCLVRLERNAFTQEDVEFLSQIAGQVAIAIDNALAYRKITELSDKLTQEKLYLEDEIRSEMNFEEIVGDSAILRRVLRQVEAVAPTESAVLIYGETGTGKELIARAVHKLSQRDSNAFVKLNCAAIPTGLLESELFGHEKGAFTGAISQRTGRFELASQGTIFLDEVGEIPLKLQPKLLRVLQEREFERLGSSRTLRTNARLIAATNRDLQAMVEEHRFRSDLFYRLNVFPIQVPPLRERPEDIPFLVRHFAQHFARNMKRQIDTIAAETMNALVHYSWPGNTSIDKSGEEALLMMIRDGADFIASGLYTKHLLESLKAREAYNTAPDRRA